MSKHFSCTEPQTLNCHQFLEEKKGRWNRRKVLWKSIGYFDKKFVTNWERVLISLLISSCQNFTMGGCDGTLQ